MNNDAIKRVLSAPVNLLRPSSGEEQQQLFPNHKGCFYTIGLKSGQTFVAKFPNNGKGEDPFNLDNYAFVLRPLNNLVPHLLEIKWMFTGSFGGPGTNTFCEVALGTTKEERLFLQDIMQAHAIQSPYRGGQTYQTHEMFTKLRNVHDQLLENDHLKSALMAGQRKLQSLMMLNDVNSIDQASQHVAQERIQRNG